MPKIVMLTRYGIDSISESSTGPMVAVRLYASTRHGAEVLHTEFALDPDLATEIGQALCDAASRMKRIEPTQH